MIKPHLLVSSSLRVRISLHMFSRPCRTGFVIAVILVFDTSVHRVVADPPAVSTKLSADQAAAIDRITSDSLRGHLSFLASDLLEGRDTPSRGLDLAAEYIAAQFRRAGLEAIGDDGYFQTAHWKLVEPDADGFSLEVKSGEGPPIRVSNKQISVQRSRAFDATANRVFKIDARDAKTLDELAPTQVEGMAVLVELPEAGSRDRAALTSVSSFMTRMTALKASVVVNVSRQPGAATGFGPGRLIDPDNTLAGGPTRAERTGPPLITVHDPKVLAVFESLAKGPANKTAVSIHLGEPITRPVNVRNVMGLLRGSDPALKDTYVIVTAHYDHVGIRGDENAKGDRIYNGANDDGSGTVSVIELATALATLKDRPRRSILFMTFFGEEKGLLGSRYYGRHPVVPIEKTVADVNLEQVGRTDDSEGPRVGAAVMTGFGYSDVSDIFAAAGQAEGVRLDRHPQFSDTFFGRSDNQALADLGVPAHTIGVAFMFPDYHRATDHWDKIDYANMAKVDRMVAHGLLMIANNPVEPKWTESNPKAAKYLKAWKARHAK
jgi:Peptidase family M28